MARVLLGVCGGISAYKSAELASRLIKSSHEVKTVMTKSAEKFITSHTFSGLTSNRVYTDLFERTFNEKHTGLAGWADLIIVAPATATTLAKLSVGIADELLTAIILDYDGPVYLCPAMHKNMYKNCATQNNLQNLKERGFRIIGPARGKLASGEKGVGRMEEPADIIKKVNNSLKESGHSSYKNEP